MEMRKRQLTKRTVFAAICLTIVVIWQRQWLTGDNIPDTDEIVVQSVADGFGGFDSETHRAIYRQTDYPRIQGKSTSNLEAAERFSFNRTPINVFIRGDKENKLDETENWYTVMKNKPQTSTTKAYKNSRTPVKTDLSPVKNNSEGRGIDDGTSNIEQENPAYIPKPTKAPTGGDARESSTSIMPKPLAEDEVSNNAKEDISNEDDELAGFIAQQNFRRRGEEYSQNASARLQNKIKELELGKKPETFESKPQKTLPPAENDLMKINGIIIKDDSSDFFGQMPVFADDLPIRNNSLRTEDQIPQKEDETSEIQSQKPSAATEEEILPDTEEDEDLNTEPLIMDGVLILGNVSATRKYAVFSTTTENRDSLSFIFYIPLTVLAWKRIGFDSVVIVVGAKDEWDADPLLYHVLSTARRLDCVVIFLEPRPEKSVMISQVARIFAANILRSTFRGIDDVYMVTSDADIWPIYGDVYNLPRGKRILSLNSDCCSPFNHRGTSYKMLPMANIGMTVRTWRQITRKFGDSPKNIDDILTYFVQEFGTVALRPVHKGDNVGWYLDQMMISILISKWTKEHGAKTVKFVPRDVGVDRIDRAGWSLGQNSIEEKVDAHLLLEAYVPGVWVRVTHLLRAMYGDMTERFVWCVNYYETFQHLFLEKYRSNGRT